MDGQKGKAYLKDYLEKTDSAFEHYLHQKIDEALEISKIPAELLKRFLDTARRGKKIRGALVVLGYLAAGGTDEKEILDTSLFIELFHAGVLVHDDIMDQDELRRGLPALHTQFQQIGATFKLTTSPQHYGESMAINIGDAAFYQSWEKLLQGNFPVENKLKAGQIYSKYILRVVHGQILDITNVAMKNLTERDVLEVLKLKTAEYTGVLPLLSGATLAGLEDQKRLDAMEEYGLYFGWAFQIQDDILGMFGDEEKTGKPIGSDLKEGKNTLLMIYAMRQGNESQKEKIRETLGNPDVTPEDIASIQTILKETNAYQHTLDLGWEYVEKAQKVVPLITSDPEYQEILQSLVVYMMERTQ